MRSLPEQRGVAIVLAAGMLSLLALLAALIAGVARISGPAAARGTAALRASLAAESGLEYAAARLSREAGFPLPPAGWRQASRGDDWNPRLPHPAPPGASDPWHYPSYRHGEGWAETIPLKGDGLDNDRDGTVDEPDEGIALLSPGEAPAVDPDGNGKVTAWTGRMRGAGPRFALRIDCPEGKLPVNAGFLDHRSGDLTHPYHKGIAHALDNLGAVLNLSGTRTFKAGAPLGSGEPVVLSSLGTDLMTARPPGGYPDLAAAGELLALRGYTSGDIARVLTYLDAGPYELPCEAGRAAPGDGTYFPDSPHVNLKVAPREVLESLFRYLAASVPMNPAGKPLLPGDPPSGIPSKRAGGLPFHEAGASRALLLVIWPDEAAALADLVLKRRQDSTTAFSGFCERVMKDPAIAFLQDAADLGPLFPGWGAAKAQLAFTAISPDPCPAPIQGHALWSSGGILGPDGERMLAVVNLTDVRRIRHPEPDGTWTPDDLAPYREPGAAILPPWGILAPPSLFDVASCGRSEESGDVRLSGRLRALERLVFTSQEDFENLSGGPALARRGIRADDPDPAGRFGFRAGPAGPSPEIVSFPRRNRRSFSATPESPPWYGFSRSSGMLALSHACNPQGASLYFPFTDDWDPASDAEFMPRGAAVRRYPVSPGRHPPDDPAFTPCSVEMDPAAGAFRFDCPGLSAGVPYLDGKQYSFTLSAWMHPGGRIVLWGDGRRLLCLSLDRTQHDEATVTLAVDWIESSGFPFKDTLSWVVPYSPGPEFVSSWSLALAVTFLGTDSDDRYFQVYANGLEYDVLKRSMRMKLSPGAKLACTLLETLDLSGVSNVRIYDLPTEPVDAKRRCSIFSGWGIFRSPRYFCPGPEARLRSASCSVPTIPLPEFGCAVDLHAYDDTGTELPGSPVLVYSIALSDLSRLGPARSFDYEVRLQGDTYVSPVFESIWIALQRRGRAPAWVVRD